ncbi:hypothetical protein SY85_19010 [Flavisolibacter tropicus]|uniref:Uncharacterized protein n=1 Tax=Flavisolibacter tropicus TaxID=1492898 RepID=A0A172TZQ2_9BACT|nr:hypothetical protein SY85_19010 [Flavisolibacter tropicus]
MFHAEALRAQRKERTTEAQRHGGTQSIGFAQRKVEKEKDMDQGMMKEEEMGNDPKTRRKRQDTTHFIPI